MRNLRKSTKIIQTKSKGLPREARAKRERSGGFGLVEAIVAVSVAIFSIIAVWKVYTLFLKLSLSNPSLFQASFLAEEGIEAVKYMRDDGWSRLITPLAPGASYSLLFDGSGWRATTTHSLIDGQFDRQVVLSEVSRNASDDIDVTGTPDLQTRKVTVSVSWWKDSATSTKEITTYVTNIHNN